MRVRCWEESLVCALSAKHVTIPCSNKEMCLYVNTFSATLLAFAYSNRVQFYTELKISESYQKYSFHVMVIF